MLLASLTPSAASLLPPLLHPGAWLLQVKAEAAAMSRQKRGKDKGGKKPDDEIFDEGPQGLLERPKEYVVNFTFPNPPELAPPILGIHGAYTTAPPVAAISAMASRVMWFLTY